MKLVNLSFINIHIYAPVLTFKLTNEDSLLLQPNTAGLGPFCAALSSTELRDGQTALIKQQPLHLLPAPLALLLIPWTVQSQLRGVIFSLQWCGRWQRLVCRCPLCWKDIFNNPCQVIQSFHLLQYKMFPILWKGDNSASLLRKDFLQPCSFWFPFSTNSIPLCSTTLGCVNLAWNRDWRQKRPLWSSRIFLRDSCMRLHSFSCQGNNYQSFPSLAILMPPSRFAVSCYNKKNLVKCSGLQLLHPDLHHRERKGKTVEDPLLGVQSEVYLLSLNSVLQVDSPLKMILSAVDSLSNALLFD